MEENRSIELPGTCIDLM